VGVVYDERAFNIDLPGRERIDVWAADALALPFAPGTFSLISAQHVLDCVTSPITLLHALSDALARGGAAVLASPYDWSPGAVPYESWIGGHSQRGPQRGASEPLLRDLLTPGAHPQSVAGLSIVGEDENVPWHVRLHDRAVMRYRAHVLALRRE
jgi:SAM-dependent methyltransferase